MQALEFPLKNKLKGQPFWYLKPRAHSWWWRPPFCSLGNSPLTGTHPKLETREAIEKKCYMQACKVELRLILWKVKAKVYCNAKLYRNSRFTRAFLHTNI